MTIRKMAASAALAACLLLAGGCAVQPDPTLEPLKVSDGSDIIPFGSVSALPTATPTPQPQATPSPTPDTWTNSDQSTWEEWSGGELPTPTPRKAATAAPDQKTWDTSTTDYNAGYPVLRLGSVGTDVQDLQIRLTELRYFTGAADGRFGTDTQQALMDFQTRNGLTADGIAGRETQDLLYTSLAQPKVVSAETQQEEYILLKEGTSGLEVRKLQGRLAELGYYAGGVDGVYGRTTTEAVKAFQRANYLSADGQAGVQTQKKLYSTTAVYSKTPVTTANPDQPRALTVGMTGNDVYALQERLIELRYLSGVADGVFGEETRQALIAYQKNNNLTADGEAGLATLKKLAGSSKAATKNTPTKAPVRTIAMREGDTGDDVYSLQARLFELGYYEGRIDGRYSAETTAAVIRFQEDNGLTADGMAGKGTLARMETAEKARKETDKADTETSGQTGTFETLRRGSKGDGVLVMQQYLHDFGYLSGEPDGQFGAATERAVKLFQEANGMTADGIAGTGTLSLLLSGQGRTYGESFGKGAKGATPVPAAATPVPTAVPNTSVILQWESEGTDVMQYQSRLAELGYLQSKYVTGKFNQPTVNATKAFQKMNGLKVDGAAGPESLKLVYSDNALDASGVRVKDRIGKALDTEVSSAFTAGMADGQIREAQQKLASLGYLSSSFVSGILDTETEKALRTFQQANGLSGNGSMDENTLSTLYSGSAMSAQVQTASSENVRREREEYRLNGAYQTNLAGGGFLCSDADALYFACREQQGALCRQEKGSSQVRVLSQDIPRELHITNGRLYYVASDEGEDCVIRLDTRNGHRDVIYRGGILSRFCLHDGTMYVLDASGTLKERDFGGNESELMTGVQDFSMDVPANRCIAVTGEGVVALELRTGKQETLYAGRVRQALQMGDYLLALSAGEVLRISGMQAVPIRRDGANRIGVSGDRILELTEDGVIAFDINGEHANQVQSGHFDTFCIADGMLYLGDAAGYTLTCPL